LKKNIIIYISITTILILALYIQLFFNNPHKIYLLNNNNDINISLPPKIKKPICKINYITNDEKWIIINNKTKKEDNKNKTLTTLKIKNDKLKFKEITCLYIGEYNKNPIFLCKPKNKLIILKPNENIPNTPIKYIKNSNKEIIFKFNDKNYTLIKPFINIKKYQIKEKNEKNTT
jgi:hypothetical protein